MSRLTNKNRIVDRDAIFYDKYRQDSLDGIEELVTAYGDTIILLRKQIAKNSSLALDTTGTDRMEGRLSGRRLEMQTGFGPEQVTEYKRPEQTETEEYNPVISIPAIVIVNSGLKEDSAMAFLVALNPTCYLSIKWLNEKGITINAAQDLISYKNDKYAIDDMYQDNNFLNHAGQMILRLRKTTL